MSEEHQQAWEPAMVSLMEAATALAWAGTFYVVVVAVVAVATIVFSLLRD